MPKKIAARDIGDKSYRIHGLHFPPLFCVSHHPDYMDALVAMGPLAKTPTWTVAVLEASRKAIMNVAAWASTRRAPSTGHG